MSSTRHAVQPGESLTGWGYLPVLTPAKNAERLTGKRASTDVSCATGDKINSPSFHCTSIMETWNKNGNGSPKNIITLGCHPAYLTWLNCSFWSNFECERRFVDMPRGVVLPIYYKLLPNW